MNDILQKVIVFADNAHGEQLRKYSGERYIVHPVRVMKICKEVSEDLPLLSAALLHDVLEDTPVSTDDILDFLQIIMPVDAAKETLDLVVDLTDVFVKDNYPGLNRKVRKSKEVDRLSKIKSKAQTVKYADIIDNSIDIAQNDVDFARVYLREMKQLLIKMDKGHPYLYEKAQQTVENCLKIIKK
jgi:hypothetical protein